MNDKSLGNVASQPGSPAVSQDSAPPAERSAPLTDRPTTELLGSLVADGRELIRKEMEVVRLELQSEVKQIKKAGIALGVAGFLLVLGSLMLTMAVGFGLSSAGDMGEWAGFIIVSGVLAVIGIAFLLYGMKRSREAKNMAAESAKDVRQDVKWLKKPTTGVS